MFPIFVRLLGDLYLILHIRHVGKDDKIELTRISLPHCESRFEVISILFSHLLIRGIKSSALKT
jgi:hypothetical protein